MGGRPVQFYRHEMSPASEHGAFVDGKAIAMKVEQRRAPDWTKPNKPTCAPVLPESKVLSLEIGSWTRCATVTVPADAYGPMPVLFWFHAAGGDAAKPQCGHFAQIGLDQKFVVVCAEALQGVFGGWGGYWSLPEIVTADVGNVCNYSNPYAPGGADLHYIMELLERFDQEPAIYDTSRLFFAGCSMGSHFSMYVSTCIKQKYPQRVSAFATHSSGLKIKGDGLVFPSDLYHPDYQWGECPDCEFAPIRPENFDDSIGLKACIFDNTGDLPDFYWSSINLAETWLQHGNKVELHAVSAGVHCEIKDYNEIIQCLDDDSGRLRGGPYEEMTVLNAEHHRVLGQGPFSLQRKRGADGWTMAARRSGKKWTLAASTDDDSQVSADNIDWLGIDLPSEKWRIAANQTTMTLAHNLERITAAITGGGSRATRSARNRTAAVSTSSRNRTAAASTRLRGSTSTVRRKSKAKRVHNGS